METSDAKEIAKKCLILDSGVLHLYRLYTKYIRPIQPVKSIKICKKYSMIRNAVGINPLIKANADEILTPFIVFRWEIPTSNEIATNAYKGTEELEINLMQNMVPNCTIVWKNKSCNLLLQTEKKCTTPLRDNLIWDWFVIVLDF